MTLPHSDLCRPTYSHCFSGLPTVPRSAYWMGHFRLLMSTTYTSITAWSRAASIITLLISLPFFPPHTPPLCPLVPCPHCCSSPLRVRFLTLHSISAAYNIAKSSPISPLLSYSSTWHLSLNLFIYRPSQVPSSGIVVNGTPTNTSTQLPDIWGHFKLHSTGCLLLRVRTRGWWRIS